MAIVIVTSFILVASHLTMQKLMKKSFTEPGMERRELDELKEEIGSLKQRVEQLESSN